MFGFVTANMGELTPEQKDRYTAVYCGICRNIRSGSSNLCRCCLSYDVALLALVLMSLYEPEETVGDRACVLHPIRPRPWTENEFTRYAADMNVALAYYNAVDDWCDDKKLSAKAAASVLEPHLGPIKERYPRQCQAIEDCICRLAKLEQENCPNPDEPANCFGELMGQLFVYREDLWQEDLFGMGMALGRFVYLTDAAVDYPLDEKKKKYIVYIMAVLGMYIAYANAQSSPLPQFLSEAIIGWVFGALSVAGLLLQICGKTKKQLLLAKILVVVSVVAGIVELFLNKVKRQMKISLSPMQQFPNQMTLIYITTIWYQPYLTRREGYEM